MNISRLYHGQDIDIEVSSTGMELNYFNGTYQVAIPVVEANDIELLMKACEELYAKIYAQDAREEHYE